MIYYSACLLCTPGNFSSSPGQQYCSQCSPGFFSNVSGQSSCYPCGIGSYNPNNEATSCILCNPGTFNPNTQMTSSSACTNCAVNTFSIAYGQDHCDPWTPPAFSAAGSSICSCSGVNFFDLTLKSSYMSG